MFERWKVGHFGPRYLAITSSEVVYLRVVMDTLVLALPIVTLVESNTSLSLELRPSEIDCAGLRLTFDRKFYGGRWVMLMSQ